MAENSEEEPKVCPFMSKGHMKVYCKQDRCALWTTVTNEFGHMEMCAFVVIATTVVP